MQGTHLGLGHRGDHVRRGRVAAVGMVAVQPAQQALPGDHRGLAAGDRDLLDDPLPFTGELARRVDRPGEHLGDQIEQGNEIGRERGADDGEPVRVHPGRERSTQRLDGRGELDPVPRLGTGEQGFGEQLGAGLMRGATTSERDAQPHLHQWHAGPPDHQYPQPARQHPLGHRGKIGRNGRRHRRDKNGPGAAAQINLAHDAAPARSSSTDRP